MSSDIQETLMGSSTVPVYGCFDTDLRNLRTDSGFFMTYLLSLNYNLLVHKPFPQPCTGSLQVKCWWSTGYYHRIEDFIEQISTKPSIMEGILIIRCFSYVIMFDSVLKPRVGTGIYQWETTTSQALNYLFSV